MIPAFDLHRDSTRGGSLNAENVNLPTSGPLELTTSRGGRDSDPHETQPSKMKVHEVTVTSVSSVGLYNGNNNHNNQATGEIGHTANTSKLRIPSTDECRKGIRPL